MSVLIRYDWKLTDVKGKPRGPEFYGSKGDDGFYHWETNIKKAKFFDTLEEAQEVGQKFAKYEFIGIEYLDADSRRIIAGGSSSNVHESEEGQGSVDEASEPVGANDADTSESLYQK